MRRRHRHPLIDQLGLPTVKGRLLVSEQLTVPGQPAVYAIGDAAAVPDLTKDLDEDGHRPLCPPTAQHAMRQAATAAHNIIADLTGATVKRYRHHDLGLVVDLGGSDAAATPFGLRLRGRPAKWVARGYHLYALPTLRRRARVAANWAFAGRTPDDVSLGAIDKDEALIKNSESGPG